MNKEKWNRDSKGTFVVKPGARIEKTCTACGKTFTTWASRLIPIKTCSRTCMGKMMQRREDRNCKFCSKVFSFQLSQALQDPRRGQYCSALCRNAAKVKRHESRPVPERYKNEAHLKGDKEWKCAVRVKDNFTCQRCGKQDPYIHAHHVNPRSRRPDLIREVSNGKCLCASCHAWVHMNPAQSTKLGLLGGETYEKAHGAA